MTKLRKEIFKAGIDFEVGNDTNICQIAPSPSPVQRYDLSDYLGSGTIYIYDSQFSQAVHYGDLAKIEVMVKSTPKILDSQVNIKISSKAIMIVLAYMPDNLSNGEIETCYNKHCSNESNKEKDLDLIYKMRELRKANPDQKLHKIFTYQEVIRHNPHLKTYNQFNQISSNLDNPLKTKILADSLKLESKAVQSLSAQDREEIVEISRKITTRISDKIKYQNSWTGWAKNLVKSYTNIFYSEKNDPVKIKPLHEIILDEFIAKSKKANLSYADKIKQERSQPEVSSARSM